MWRRKRALEGLERDIRHHLEQEIQDHIARGVAPDEARRRALLKFGNVTLVAEDTRAVWSLVGLEQLLQDLRYAVRTIRQNRTFAAVAVLSLALGIGANTAIFSLIEAVLLRPVPVGAPHELFFLAHRADSAVSTNSNYPYYERVRDRTDVFAGVTAYFADSVKVTRGDVVETTSSQFVSGNYHGLLGVSLELGRGFTSEDDRPGPHASVAVISYSYWTLKFDGDPNVLGRTVVVNGNPVSIVGVTAEGFDGLERGRRIDVTLPLAFRALDDPGFLTAHDNLTSMPLVARLEVGISEQQALLAADAVLQRYLAEPENQWWQRTRNNHPRTAAMIPAAYGSTGLRNQYSAALRVLMAIVAIVLAIGCANIAGLLLARRAARLKEVAIRISLGAPRWRLTRQFLTESLVLAIAGGALGFVLAWWGTAVIASWFATRENPLIVDPRPNGTVLMFTAAISVLAALLFGLAPAVSGTRVNAVSALKSGAEGPGSFAWRGFGHRIVVAAQVALCAVLLVSAGLLVGTLRNLEGVDLGFDSDNVLMFSMDSEGTPVPASELPRICDQLLERFRQRTGARAVSCSTSVPVRGSGSVRALTVPGLPPDPTRDAFANQVTPDYFQTFGVTLVRGRRLTTGDTAGSPKVIVINETFARDYFPGTDPLGRTLRFGIQQPSDPMVIVGVVRDTVQFGLREPSPRIVYTPLAQGTAVPRSLTLALRSSEPAASLAAVIRSEVRTVSRDVVIDYVRTMDEQIAAALTRERVLSVFSVWFGGLALTLVCVGLYGVLSYEVRRRVREIGIRLALGAQPAAVMKNVLRQAVLIVAIGGAVGLGAAMATTKMLAALLYGLAPRDPATIAWAGAVLMVTALLAGYLPARRAARVNPMSALRNE